MMMMMMINRMTKDDKIAGLNVGRLRCRVTTFDTFPTRYLTSKLLYRLEVYVVQSYTLYTIANFIYYILPHLLKDIRRLEAVQRRFTKKNWWGCMHLLIPNVLSYLAWKDWSRGELERVYYLLINFYLVSLPFILTTSLYCVNLHVPEATPTNFIYRVAQLMSASISSANVS